MIRTVIGLIATLLLIPISVIYFDKPMNADQWDVFRLLIRVYLVTGLVLFFVGEITSNVSQVDKLWSIMPIVYGWILAYHGHFDGRLLLMAVLVTIWGVRLTYNFNRRGGYHWIPWKGEEDYRWAILRQQPFLQHKFAWRLFHLFFICLYQMGLILLFCLPMLVCYEGKGKPISIADYILGTFFVVLVIIEYFADQQQYDFQTEKFRRIKSGIDLGDYVDGFIKSGLWSKVRHPNYSAEQAIWITFYLFSIGATERYVNWSIAGCILLMLLFLGSSDFSEKISISKYPKYLDYVAKTPRFFPKIF